MIPVPDENHAKPGNPFAARVVEKVLNEENPQVSRRETYYIRRSDGKVLAKAVGYSRVGGDIPSFGHPTYLMCPDPDALSAATRRVFVIEGDKK